jgi:tRNA(Ile2) C34 agmatinyltransferase TiaS
MEVVCDLCGAKALQVGKEVFYCRDCDKIVTVMDKEKEKLPEIY